MKKAYERWTVRGVLRESLSWTRDGTPFPDGRELVVNIYDPGDGTTVEIELAADRESIASLRLDDNRGISGRTLERLPIPLLLDVAQTYYRAVDHYLRTDKLDLPQAIALADRNPGEVESSTARPTALEFATEWKQVASKLKRGHRDALAARYGVSKPTIDKWTREARDRGLIPATDMGRPRIELHPAKTSAEQTAEKQENGDKK